MTTTVSRSERIAALNDALRRDPSNSGLSRITLTSGVAFARINLKCDPELALELRAQYDAVQPGYQMNKKHWNTVIFDGSISDEEIYEMIDHSYDLIVSNLLDSERERLLKNG